MTPYSRRAQRFASDADRHAQTWRDCQPVTTEESRRAREILDACKSVFVGAVVGAVIGFALIGVMVAVFE